MKILLYLFSWVYGLVVRILMSFSRLARCYLRCKVISVGNITLGGTGKTVLVEYIARYLKEQGHAVAILSRGYKSGDESLMLAQHLPDVPVLVGADRIHSAELALSKHGVDTVILDDGFQQWRIYKDLEIVTINVDNPFGNRSMLPRGILRQPLSTLRRADIFILTKTDMGSSGVCEVKGFLSQLNPGALIFESVHKPTDFYRIDQPQETIPLYTVRDRRVALVSGIADPLYFENTMRRLSANSALLFSFPDHHVYTKEDWRGIFQECQEQGIDTIVTTEKDGVRIRPQFYAEKRFTILVLRVTISILNNEKDFYNRLLKLYLR